MQDVRSCAVIILLMNYARTAVDQLTWKYNIKFKKKQIVAGIS